MLVMSWGMYRTARTYLVDEQTRTKQTKISTFWLSSVLGSHPRDVDSNSAQINHTSLLSLTIHL